MVPSGPHTSRVSRTISTFSRIQFKSGSRHTGVVPSVRPGHEELVDELALVAHDIDPVVPRATGQDGTAEEVADHGPHARGGQLPGQ